MKGSPVTRALKYKKNTKLSNRSCKQRKKHWFFEKVQYYFRETRLKYNEGIQIEEEILAPQIKSCGRRKLYTRPTSLENDDGTSKATRRRQFFVEKHNITRSSTHEQ